MALDAQNKIINAQDGIVVDGTAVEGGYFVTESTEITTTGESGKIPSYACVEGALCYCKTEGKFYQYDGKTWKPNIVTQDNAIAGLYTIYGKRKLATTGEAYPEFEQGQECVFRGGYYPNDFKDFEKGDRRVVMYGKKGTFSVDMAEDRGDTPEDKHVVNRKFLAENYVPKLGYSQTVPGQEYQVYATQTGKPVRVLDVHKGSVGNTLMMRDGSGASSVKAPANWKDNLSTNAEKIANVNMLTEYAVPKISYTQGSTGQEYQVYATMSGNPTKVLNVHKGAVSDTLLMRDSSGTGSINAPSNWMGDVSANAQKIVNVNMLVDYTNDSVTKVKDYIDSKVSSRLDSNFFNSLY